MGWCASQFQDALLSLSPEQVGVNSPICVRDSNLLTKLCKDFNIRFFRIHLCLHSCAVIYEVVVFGISAVPFQLCYTIYQPASNGSYGWFTAASTSKSWFASKGQHIYEKIRFRSTRISFHVLGCDANQYYSRASQHKQWICQPWVWFRQEVSSTAKRTMQRHCSFICMFFYSTSWSFPNPNPQVL